MIFFLILVSCNYEFHFYYIVACFFLYSWMEGNKTFEACLQNLEGQYISYTKHVPTLDSSHPAQVVWCSTITYKLALNCSQKIVFFSARHFRPPTIETRLHNIVSFYRIFFQLNRRRKKESLVISFLQNLCKNFGTRTKKSSSKTIVDQKKLLEIQL